MHKPARRAREFGEALKGLSGPALLRSVGRTCRSKVGRFCGRLVPHYARAIFERFDHRARNVVVIAQEEARRVEREAIGSEHVLIGVGVSDASLMGMAPSDLRALVDSLFGRGSAPSPHPMPFTPEAQRALELAVEEAAFRGDDMVRPAHVLLTLLATDQRIHRVFAALERDVDEVSRRAEAAAERAPTTPSDPLESLRLGHPVMVTLGDGHPLGDLGNRRTDARLLEAILAAGGRAAGLLRRHGVDESALDALRNDNAGHRDRDDPDDSDEDAIGARRPLPETRESLLRPAPWTEIVALGGDTHFRVIAELGTWPIEDADVDESRDGRVAITLYERIPAADEQGGRFRFDVGFPYHFDVTLTAPLGGRELFDGFTGRTHKLSPRRDVLD